MNGSTSNAANRLGRSFFKISSVDVPWAQPISRISVPDDALDQRMKAPTSPRWNQARKGLFTSERSRADMSAMLTAPFARQADVPVRRGEGRQGIRPSADIGHLERRPHRGVDGAKIPVGAGGIEDERSALSL